MLIKYYATDASLIIIDNIQDVRVPANPAYGDFSSESWQVFDFDSEVTEDHPKVITYAKDGPCVLKVRGVAYICTDDGKTIEKVIEAA